MSDQTRTVEEYIAAKLTGDGNLMAMVPGGVHNGQSPDGKPYPLIIFNQQSSVENPTNSDDGYTRFIYLIKAVTKEKTWATAYDIIARVDELLNRTRDDAGGISFLRYDRVRYIEQDGDIRYNHYGITYAVTAQS